jgi:hypothetical protein
LTAKVVDGQSVEVGEKLLPRTFHQRLDDKLHQFRLRKWCSPILKIIHHSGSNDLASRDTTTLTGKLIPSAWAPNTLQDAHSD